MQRDRGAHERQVEVWRLERLFAGLAAVGAWCLRSLLVVVLTVDAVSFQSAEPLPPPPAPPAVEDAPPPGPARPAWRTVHKRKEKVKQITAAPSSPAPAPPLEAPKPGIPAWSQWRRA